MRRRLMTAAALLALTGCGDRGPTTLQPASDQPVPGTQRVQCRLPTASGSQVTFAFDLPRGFRAGLPDNYDLDADTCGWHRRVDVVEEGTDGTDPYDHRDSIVIVTVQAPTGSLHEVEEDVEVDAVDGNVPRGDDSNLRLDYDEGVPTYGPTVGEQFRYLCFCDGQNNRHWYAEADGVRMHWAGEDRLGPGIETQFEAALASAGIGDPT